MLQIVAFVLRVLSVLLIETLGSTVWQSQVICVNRQIVVQRQRARTRFQPLAPLRRLLRRHFHHRYRRQAAQQILFEICKENATWKGERC